MSDENEPIEEPNISDELIKLQADYDIAVAAIDDLKALVSARDETVARQVERIAALLGDKAALIVSVDTYKKGFESQQRLHAESVARIAALKKRAGEPAAPPDAKPGESGVAT